MEKERAFEPVDIATVVYEPEVLLLALQARSLVRFLDRRLVSRLFIIVNELAPEGSYSAIARYVLPEYKDLIRRVEIIPATNLIRPHAGVKGWRTQQSLKLLISRLVETDHYLLLDAKNHFIKPVSYANLFDRGGRMRTFRVTNHGSLNDYLVNSLSYFSLPQQQPFSLPATTPYLVSTNVVRNLINYVEQREQARFDDFFHAPGINITEFFLYFAYIISNDGMIDKLYKIGPRNAASLFTRWPNNIDQLEAVLQSAEKPNVWAFGLHKNRIGTLDDNFVSRICELWVRVGLFSSNREAVEFFSLLKDFADRRTVSVRHEW